MIDWNWIVLWVTNVSIVFAGVYLAVILNNWMMDRRENRGQ